ncbi:hypothetical protein GUJ93_ZPchr0010g10374 [Zizania palustris]|uniref:Uncharacterized protein n=1 Tax=Zizania palustris TaxID=103762 RepID=A0A8J6BRX4_ZIZPA|nr:hypothetical protein GUJ93_ZPchr0010g10374 [Zizania palustris]
MEETEALGQGHAIDGAGGRFLGQGQRSSSSGDRGTKPRRRQKGPCVGARGPNTAGDKSNHSGRGSPHGHFTASINGGLRQRFCPIVPASGLPGAHLTGRQRRCTGTGKGQVLASTANENRAEGKGPYNGGGCVGIN